MSRVACVRRVARCGRGDRPARPGAPPRPAARPPPLECSAGGGADAVGLGGRLEGTGGHGPPDGGRRPGRGHLGQRVGTGRRHRPGHPQRHRVRPPRSGRTVRRRPGGPAGGRRPRAHQRAADAPGGVPLHRRRGGRPHPRRARHRRLHPRRRTPGGPLHGRHPGRSGPRGAVRTLRQRGTGRPCAGGTARPQRLPAAQPRHGRVRRQPRPGVRQHRPAGVDVPCLARRRLRARPHPVPAAVRGAGPRRRAAARLRAAGPARPCRPPPAPVRPPADDAARTGYEVGDTGAGGAGRGAGFGPPLRSPAGARPLAPATPRRHPWRR